MEEGCEGTARIVYLYFMHGNTLDEQKAAILYANILTYEDEQSEIYRHYQEEMETFAWDQLIKRQISEELRIIYKSLFGGREDDTGAIRCII